MRLSASRTMERAVRSTVNMVSTKPMIPGIMNHAVLFSGL